MRIRQMGFSSRLVAHRHLLTLETLRFIVAYLELQNPKMAALRAGIPETYAYRQGRWLMKHPMVVRALDRDIDDQDLKKLHKSIQKIEQEMESCKELLGLE